MGKKNEEFGERERGRKTWLTGITDGRMQQIHARGCETQAIDCIRWLLKIRHHAKVVAGWRVGRNPGEGEPPESPACPGGCRRAGGAARCLRRPERREGEVRPARCPPSFYPRCLSPSILRLVKPDPSRIWELGKTD